MAKEGGFFSPSANKDNRIGANTKKPLSPIGSDAYNKEVEGFIKDFKDDFNYRNKFDVDTGQRKDKYGITVAELFKNEENIQELIVKKGFGVIYKRYSNQCDWSKNS